MYGHNSNHKYLQLMAHKHHWFDQNKGKIFWGCAKYLNREFNFFKWFSKGHRQLEVIKKQNIQHNDEIKKLIGDFAYSKEKFQII